MKIECLVVNCIMLFVMYAVHVGTMDVSIKDKVLSATVYDNADVRWMKDRHQWPSVLRIFFC